MQHLEKPILIKMLHSVLFDLDGVLVDACDWHYKALNMALIDMGYGEINKHDHNSKYNGLPTRIKLEMLGIDLKLASQINDLKQKYTLDIIESECVELPEKIELLTFLKEKNIKIACVTNSIKMTAIKMLSKSGQLSFIDLLVTNEDVVKNKPNPDCYNYAVDKLNVDPKYSMCVEDSPKGIDAAKTSKVNFLWTVNTCQEVNLITFKTIMKEKFK